VTRDSSLRNGEILLELLIEYSRDGTGWDAAGEGNESRTVTEEFSDETDHKLLEVSFVSGVMKSQMVQEKY
jgi:hypothetical protein